MLEKLSVKITECYARALVCRRQSELTNDPRVRHTFIELECEWQKLAKGLEFAENLDRYLQNGGRYQVYVGSNS